MMAKKKRSTKGQMSGKKPKRWVVALLLSIFLGGLGIDRFYMGYVGTGILKLLISVVTLGMLSWVWWIIDIILIATKYDFARVKWVD